MLARLARELPVSGYLYEPKWDGFRAVAFRAGGWVDLQSRNLNPFGRYFPELAEALLKLPETSFTVDGEIVILGQAGFDFGALLKRRSPSSAKAPRRSDAASPSPASRNPPTMHSAVRSGLTFNGTSASRARSLACSGTSFSRFSGRFWFRSPATLGSTVSGSTRDRWEGFAAQRAYGRRRWDSTGSRSNPGWFARWCTTSSTTIDFGILRAFCGGGQIARRARAGSASSKPKAPPN